jgi:hypothetical protein
MKISFTFFGILEYCNFTNMKFLKRIINALILASIGIILYLLFSVYSSDSNEIHNGIIIIYIIGIIISLTTIRIAIKNVGLFQKLTVLFAMISILLSSILFFNRLSVNALWNYTLITFLITISLSLLSTLKHNRKTFKLSRSLIIINALTMSLILLFKIGNPLFFKIAFVIGIITSLATISTHLLPKKKVI